MILGKEVIRTRAGFKTSLIDVPEWGGAVRIRELSGADVLRIHTIQQENEPNAVHRVTAVALAGGWIDDNGMNICTADDPDLLNIPAGIATRLVTAIMELSGQGMTPVDEAKNA